MKTAEASKNTNRNRMNPVQKREKPAERKATG